MHQLVRRYEPKTLIHMFALVLLPPVALAPLLHLASAPPSSPIRAIFISLFIYLATLTLSVVGYRLSPWHPLAGIPGPLLARVSKVWMAYVAKDGKQHTNIKALHDQYGDLARVGPNEVSVRTVD